MRTLRIDFTAENMLPDGDLAGRMGEHNATDLIITPPAEMAQCGEIVNYVAAFVTEGKIIRTDFYPKADTITVSLCSQLTQDHSLSLQLEAYDGTGGLVVKSPIVSELRLLPSAGGDETDFDGESGGMVSQINLNTLARHSHSNMGVLEKFGEDSGKLTYNGIAVNASKTKTVELDVLNSEVYIQVENGKIFISTFDDMFDSPPVPDNAKIVTLEAKLPVKGEEKWVDLKMMNRYDISYCYNLIMDRAFVVEGLAGSTYLAIIVYNKNEENFFYTAALRNEIRALRVTFIDEE